ncbi:MAG: hypothetical protein IKW13_08420, partial [Thermoguttaceae bacterium]|nr:hypothetical protein [Thermoguttaceae bacterium]
MENAPSSGGNFRKIGFPANFSRNVVDVGRAKERRTAPWFAPLRLNGRSSEGTADGSLVRAAS